MQITIAFYGKNRYVVLGMDTHTHVCTLACAHCYSNGFGAKQLYENLYYYGTIYA